MERFGNDSAGFSVGFDPQTNTVSVRGWGFWSVEVAAAFGSRVEAACHHRPAGSTLVMDMTELKPMRDEGQHSFGDLLRALPGLGIASSTIITASQLTKLQLLRLASEVGAGSSVDIT